MTNSKIVSDRAFYQNFRFFILPIVFFCFYIFIYLLNPYDPFWNVYFDQNIYTLLTEWLGVMVVCFLITESSLLIARWLDRHIPWIESPLLRFFCQFFLQIISASIVISLLLYIDRLVYPNYTSYSQSDKTFGWQVCMVSIVISTLISAIYTADFFLRKWKIAMLETSALELKAYDLNQIAMQAELQSLKAQLDPHFMFNNFSTLSSLIVENPDSALLFLDNLSKVYRYMIINLSRDIISLKEEIKFINSYIYLIKIRVSDNLQVNINIPEDYELKGVPPITLQLLIENAIKHNIASRSRPLSINVRINEDGWLEVSNNLQLVNFHIPSTRVGLKNIISRYRLLSNDCPQIIENEHTFIVKLPLLEIAE
ncbi:histidine kinase [Pedobacter sp. PAMC26386]|nr:histidine kinase [Pedobacter sp. PAMC26386]